MLDLDQFKVDVHNLIQALSIEADEDDPARQVEIAFFLWDMVNTTTRTLDTIKDRYLRPLAIEQSGGLPGPQILPGTGSAECLVHVPEPSYKLKKDTDINQLRGLLGSRFEEFFQETHTVSPRREAGNLVARLKDGPARQALLGVLTEVPGTPRVTLRSVDQN